jgi:hypothetical protein
MWKISTCSWKIMYGVDNRMKMKTVTVVRTMRLHTVEVEVQGRDKRRRLIIECSLSIIKSSHLR